MASLSVYNPLSKNEHPCLLQVLLHTRRPRIPPSARSVRGWSGAEVSRLPLRRFLCYGVGAHSWLEWQCRPSVFRCNLQYQPVRGATTREEFPWPHTCKSVKRRKGVKRNGILECNIMFENEHRTSVRPYQSDPNTAESMVKMSTLPRLVYQWGGDVIAWHASARRRLGGGDVVRVRGSLR
jgi:hypothetical protein